MRWLPVVFFGITIFFVYLYGQNNSFAAWLNGITSNRLRLAWMGLNSFRIPFWPQHIQMTAYSDVITQYTYIDSGYIQMLVVFGIVVSAVLVFANQRLIDFLQSNNDSVAIICVISILIFTMTDPEFLNIECNPLIILYSAVFRKRSDWQNDSLFCHKLVVKRRGY
ncbi:hypothetical protein Q757_08470 [Oenococcus alcoholitolerans]|uniref:Uncharacterized protein n=1 Tax=Oenococcus alcoholitolerans TaxID=931074 RepID=A0ABR4XP69_9LACO|nr:hypothetical protein Q757_08470 [Oenococcus alcoholitolerans]